MAQQRVVSSRAPSEAPMRKAKDMPLCEEKAAVYRSCPHFHAEQFENQAPALGGVGRHARQAVRAAGAAGQRGADSVLGYARLYERGGARLIEPGAPLRDARPAGVYCSTSP